MARVRRKRLFGIIIIVVIVVLIGGYFATRTFNLGVAAKRASDDGKGAVSADSTSDSTLAEADTTEGKNGDEDEKKEPDPVPVEIALVQARQISKYYYTTATLEPERKVDVLAKIAGEIGKIYVEEGSIVEAGALLCKLDDEELKITLDEARINKEKQEREFSRIKSMFEEKLISDKEFSEAKYQYEIAENKYSAAALRYGYTRIKAPFAGVVTKRHVERGQNLNVGTPLFELADLSPLLIRMYLPENEISDIRVGQKVAIHPDSDPDNVFYGRVLRIAPEVDERSGTVKVTAETRGSAVPGSFARIKIITDVREGIMSIPRRGLISDAGDLYAFVAEADTVRKAPVQVGHQDEDFAEVLSGLADGDSVVVVGAGGLRTGTKIKVLEPTMQDELSHKDESASN